MATKLEIVIAMIRKSVHTKIGSGIFRQDLERSGWNEDEIEYMIDAILSMDA